MVFHITLDNLRVAGGILLFIIALDMLHARPSGESVTPEEMKEATKRDDITVFPLATPLLSGPGTLTTVLILLRTGGTLAMKLMTILAILSTFAIAYLIFRYATHAYRILGVTASLVITRIMGLLLGALAVNFVSLGVWNIYKSRCEGDVLAINPSLHRCMLQGYTAFMGKGTILVVEDEKKIADITKAYLERDGFTVTHADTGEKALGLLRQGFDLIVLDLMLPDMDGEEICTLIRKDSDVPIIMLTAKSAEEERVKGLGMGADDYVVKPFSPKELVARVNALLRRTRKTVRTMSFNSGSLVINVENHEVMKGDKPVTLTPTEFRILLVLAERPQAVLSRLQLVNIVQGYDFEGYERTIDAHVKNLRQKIEANPREPEFVKTVYALGYKFIGTPDED